MTREDQIREAAYYKWAEDGYPPSDGVSYWRAAEEEWETSHTLKTCEKIESLLKIVDIGCSTCSPPVTDPVVKIANEDIACFPNPTPLPKSRDERTQPWRTRVLEFWKGLANTR